MRSTALLAVFLTATSLAAQDFPTPKPTEAHEVLAKEVGTWDCKVKMFFAGPDGPAAEFAGVETNDLVNNGLHLRTHFEMKMGETTFSGHGITGWDVKAKKYIGTWVDTFTTTPVRSTGSYDPKTAKFTTTSTVVDEEGNEVEQLQVTTWKGDGSKTFELFHTADGKPVKLMEMTATRRKKAD